MTSAPVLPGSGRLIFPSITEIPRQHPMWLRLFCVIHFLFSIPTLSPRPRVPSPLKRRRYRRHILPLSRASSTNTQRAETRHEGSELNVEWANIPSKPRTNHLWWLMPSRPAGVLFDDCSCIPRNFGAACLTADLHWAPPPRTSKPAIQEPSRLRSPRPHSGHISGLHIARQERLRWPPASASLHT